MSTSNTAFPQTLATGDVVNCNHELWDWVMAEPITPCDCLDCARDDMLEDFMPTEEVPF